MNKFSYNNCLHLENQGDSHIMIFRCAVLSDAKPIAKLHTESWRVTYKNALNEEYLHNTMPSEREALWLQRLTKPNETQHILVAEHEGNVVGFVCIYVNENAELGSYLDNLHVTQLSQGNGVGKALLIKAAQWCYKNSSHCSMYLLVNQDNLNAQEFYNHFGASNLKPGIWNAPDGNKVPTYIFYWDSLEELVKNGQQTH